MFTFAYFVAKSWVSWIGFAFLILVVAILRKLFTPLNVDAIEESPSKEPKPVGSNNKKAAFPHRLPHESTLSGRALKVTPSPS